MGGVIVYNSGMDGISIPPGQEQGLTIIASIVNNNENKVVWDAQFLTSKFSGFELVSFVPNNVTVGAPAGLGALASGGDLPYHYHWSASPSTGIFTSPSSPTTEFYPDSPGVYTVTVTVSDSFSASSTPYIIYPYGSAGPVSVSKSLTLNVGVQNVSGQANPLNPFLLVTNITLASNITSTMPNSTFTTSPAKSVSVPVIQNTSFPHQHIYNTSSNATSLSLVFSNNTSNYLLSLWNSTNQTLPLRWGTSYSIAFSETGLPCTKRGRLSSPTLMAKQILYFPHPHPSNFHLSRVEHTHIRFFL